jgi:hypothetical protein
MYSKKVLCSTFVKKNVSLAYDLKCDQIHYNDCYEFGHTLLGCLSLTWVLYKLSSGGKVAELMLALSCSFRCDQINYNNCHVFGRTVLYCLSLSWVLYKLA